MLSGTGKSVPLFLFARPPDPRNRVDPEDICSAKILAFLADLNCPWIK